MKACLLLLSLLFATALPALAFRDLETGSFISRDPTGFVDGPNLYAYVVDNPWTHFDPEGLWIDKKEYYRPNKNGSTTKITNITVTGKVDFQGQSAKLSKKQQEKIIDRIEKGIKKTYEKSEKGYEVNVSVDLKIADGNENKPSKDDHVFRILDHVATRTDKRTGKEVPDDTVGGSTPPGGMVTNLRFGFARSSDPNLFEKNSAHEFGHMLGLSHPNVGDPNNSQDEKSRPSYYNLGGQSGHPLNPDNNIPQGNIMRYGKGQAMATTSAQIESIDMSKINRNSN